jgi:hypothetical protein
MQVGMLHKRFSQKIIETSYFAEKPALAFVSARPICQVVKMHKK